MLCCSLRISGHLAAPIVNGGGDRFWKWKEFKLSRARDLDLDLGSGHTEYRRASPINLYLHTKFHSNRRNFLWTDGRTDIFPPILLGRLLEVDLTTRRQNTQITQNNRTQKVALVNSTTDTPKKSRLKKDRQNWFSHVLRHPARKWSVYPYNSGAHMGRQTDRHWWIASTTLTHSVMW